MLQLLRQAKAEGDQHAQLFLSGYALQLQADHDAGRKDDALCCGPEALRCMALGEALYRLQPELRHPQASSVCPLLVLSSFAAGVAAAHCSTWQQVCEAAQQRQRAAAAVRQQPLPYSPLTRGEVEGLARMQQASPLPHTQGVYMRAAFLASCDSGSTQGGVKFGEAQNINSRGVAYARDAGGTTRMAKAEAQLASASGGTPPTITMAAISLQPHLSAQRMGESCRLVRQALETTAAVEMGGLRHQQTGMYRSPAYAGFKACLWRTINADSESQRRRCKRIHRLLTSAKLSAVPSTASSRDAKESVRCCAVSAQR